MAHETARLARYAASLRYEDLPPAVIDRARASIVDTIAVVTPGRTLPWSQIVIRYANASVSAGRAGFSAGKVPPCVRRQRRWRTARWRMRLSPTI